MKTLIILIGMLFSNMSFATGGTWCSLETDNVNIEINLGNSHLPGAPVFAAAASVKMKNSEANSIDFKKEDLVGWWSSDGEIKMYFTKYIADAASETTDAELIVETKYSVAQQTYLGMIRYNGPQGAFVNEIINCEVE